MSLVDQSVLPIEALIRARLKELGLRPYDVVRACGYKNVSKGLRRFDLLRAGYFHGTEFLVAALPPVLDVAPEQIGQAMDDTDDYFEKSADAAYRASFKPHAIIKTENDRPSQLFVASALGIKRLIWLNLDLKRDPSSFPEQAIERVAKRLGYWEYRGFNSGFIPTFGRPIGFIVNYSPDHAIEFDLKGNPINVFNQSFRPGEVQMTLSKRPITEGEWQRLTGAAAA